MLMQEQRELSFCIPIMGRLSDIQSTLRKNIEDNAPDRDQVEFIIIVFDKSPGAVEWITTNYSDEIEDGYLKVYHKPENLDFFHFGKAKNAFKPYVNGRIYASLDGDNFTGYRGGHHILEVFEANNFNCIFHQFQGDWGDGTCGRVSVSCEDYIDIGYDENFLPRQWDELDLILSTLVNRPERKYVCYPGKSIIQKSFPFRRFLKENSIFPETIEIPLGPFGKFQRGKYAVGRNDSSYVEKDEKLRLFSIYNHHLSYLKNCKSSTLRNVYLKEIKDCQQEILDKVSVSELEEYCLYPKFDKSINSREVIKLVACLKNETTILKWIKHYRSLGVERFFLIDDKSGALQKILKDEEDVYVWKPMVGSFHHAKTFWLQIILNSYCTGSWTYIVEGNEFVELPITDAKIPNRTEKLVDGCESRYFPGFLLDVFPSGIKAYKNALDLNRKIYTPELMKYYQYRPDNICYQYKKNSASMRSYGEFSSWAYKIDIQYRINKTFRCLRKFPLVKWSNDMLLSHGFDNLTINGEERKSDDLLSENLLPIRHFNYYMSLTNLPSENSRTDSSDVRNDLQRQTKSLSDIMKFCAINPFAYKFVHAKLVPTPFRQKILLYDPLDFSPGTLQAYRSIAESLRFQYLHSNEIRVGDMEVFGPSFTIVLDWFRKSTPFNHTLRVKTGVYALLCTELLDTGHDVDHDLQDEAMRRRFLAQTERPSAASQDDQRGEVQRWNQSDRGQKGHRMINLSDTTFDDNSRKWYRLGCENVPFKGTFFEQIIKTVYSSLLRASDVVIDGGCHRGYHTIPMCEILSDRGLVIGFDAIPGLVRYLQEKLESLEISNALIINKAIGREVGVSDFTWVSDAEAYSGIRERGMSEEARASIQKIRVALTTLDAEIGSLGLIEKIRFVKLDLEGGEYDTLLGAQELMRASSPLIVFENDRQRSADIYSYDMNDWFSLFEGAGYSVYDVFGRRFVRDCWKTHGMPWYFFAAKRSEDIAFIETNLGVLISTLAETCSNQ